MHRSHARIVAIAITVGAGIFGAVAVAQQSQRPPAYDPAKAIEAQREGMKELAFMDGVWRGEAWIVLPTGEKRNMIQTERIGPFLDGAVKVIEGRGYTDGKLEFNALGIVSYDPAKKTYSMRSYAQGMVGDFPLTRTDDGYFWTIPAGPMTIRYTATVKGDTWREVGERIEISSEGGQAIPHEPQKFFEMNLKRVSDTDWPAAGAIAPQ